MIYHNCTRYGGGLFCPPFLYRIQFAFWFRRNPFVVKSSFVCMNSVTAVAHLHISSILSKHDEEAKVSLTPQKRVQSKRSRKKRDY